MTLIKSISGIRGTIGGVVGEGLTPVDIVRFSAAYGMWLRQRNNFDKINVVIGRDARISGDMVQHLVIGTLHGLGIGVVDLQLSTTPTVEVAVTAENAQGGIILTASHNPKQWNALKLLNEKGEFISAQDGADILSIAEKEEYNFSPVDQLGKTRVDTDYINKHIDMVLDLPLVDVEAIKNAEFKVVIDCVNSTGGLALPPLLTALGVKEIVELYCDPTGDFPHNPEPLPENLVDLSSKVIDSSADVGFSVDPDVDRLAIVCEDGTMFGEEYTLVAVSDYVLSSTPGNTVSNLSSTRALRDVTENYGVEYFASAVGEVNVVNLMKQNNAVIGGEGNGGVIYPSLHYGRDALVGIALFLSHLAKVNKTTKELRSTYPNYFISKNKIELTPAIDVDNVLDRLAEKYKDQPQTNIDGLKIEFDKEWVHLRKSNTEPIIRIYSESQSESTANDLAQLLIGNIKEIIS